MSPVLQVSGLELRAGARLLVDGATFAVRPGDRVGLVGRNGAGKTTLLKVLAGETEPAAGHVRRDDVGYLPQDSRSGDLDATSRDRVLSGRGLDDLARRMEKVQVALVERPEDPAVLERYDRLEQRWTAAGGWEADSEVERLADGLGLGVELLGRRLGTLSVGQRRRVELARLLFAGSSTLLLDEPTNHLDADSIAWLRGALAAHDGGLLLITHDVELMEAVATRVMHLDPARAQLDVYNLGYRAYLRTRAQDDARRAKERAAAEKEAARLRAQAEPLRAKATKAVAAQQMLRRAEKLLADTETERPLERVARLRLPEPAPCGRLPLAASDLAKGYGGTPVIRDLTLHVDRGTRLVVLGLNGAGKTTLLRLLAGEERPDGGSVDAGHGLRLGYFAQEHDVLDDDRTVEENLAAASPHLDDAERRGVLGTFGFRSEAHAQPAGTLSGGEKTRLSLALLVTSGANVLLLDEPTNNLDPASRDEVLGALAGYSGAVVLVTHDEGAVRALDPQRVLVLPDGDEDLWGDDYLELVQLA